MRRAVHLHCLRRCGAGAGAEAVVPLESARQPLCRPLNIRALEAWIKNEGFNVVGKKQRSMHLSLDVVVQ